MIDISRPVDVALVGGGIMSATLGVLLKRLQPDWHFQLFERLDRVAAESSEAWNNAGTGHAGNCELNYTAERPDGTIDCHKAFRINEQFDWSLQCWASLTGEGILQPAEFLHTVPHLSFVSGAENVGFLKKRHAALTESHQFAGMVFSEDPARLREWLPLLMEGRTEDEPLAATRIDRGTDVDFGALTRQLIAWLDRQPDTGVFLRHEVVDLQRDALAGFWHLKVRDESSDETYLIRARFVFIGAGGGALELLNDSGIPEADGYGGFPISGQWLRCTNPEVIGRHQAKVYGKAAEGTPPMSVPHLDTRVIGGRKELLFGPFAGFSTKFLKKGSYFDLIRSLDSDNLIPMLQAGWDNVPLTRYLIGQVLQSAEDRLDALREFYPEARADDWKLEIAGQRVQVIRDDEARGGVLEFGTEVVHAADGSLAALLGASPGASTAVAVMLEVLEACFPSRWPEWQGVLRQIIPSLGVSLRKDEALWRRMHDWTGEVLGIPTPSGTP